MAATDPDPSSPTRSFQQQVEAKEVRKLKARQEGVRHFWFGLGLSGLIGWSVAVPALLGVSLGIWIDHHVPSRLSWTLMSMLGGLLLGCWNAWIWLQREGRR